jgi:hypothetical protein
MVEIVRVGSCVSQQASACRVAACAGVEVGKKRAVAVRQRGGGDRESAGASRMGACVAGCCSCQWCSAVAVVWKDGRARERERERGST